MLMSRIHVHVKLYSAKLLHNLQYQHLSKRFVFTPESKRNYICHEMGRYV